MRRSPSPVVRPILLIVLAACGSEPASAPLPPGAIEVRGVGFQTPESVLHDSVADVYLVSNINGGGRDRDDNGFISRVSPDGELLELKWIDGAAPGVSLSAPKGSVIIADSLFVADIDSIRVFHRSTGATLRAFSVANATALNDLAVSSDGALWVSDMGDGTPETAARTGLHVIDGDSSRLVATGVQIDGPNGIAPAADGVVVAAYRANTLHRVGLNGPGSLAGTVDGGRLDGLVALPAGSLLVSSADASAIFRIAPDAGTSVAFDNLQTPADIGYDALRHRLLVPSLQGDWLLMLPLE